MLVTRAIVIPAINTCTSLLSSMTHLLGFLITILPRALHRSRLLLLAFGIAATHGRQIAPLPPVWPAYELLVFFFLASHALFGRPTPSNALRNLPLPLAALVPTALARHLLDSTCDAFFRICDHRAIDPGFYPRRMIQRHL